MRILLASRNFFPAGVVGGAQTSVKHLASALMAAGHEVGILSIDVEERHGRDADATAADFRLRLPGRDRAGGRTLLQKIHWHFKDRFGSDMDAAYGTVLDEWRPDLVNTNVLAGMGVGIWRACQARRIPIVHTIHDYYLLCLKSSMRSGAQNCSKPCRPCQIFAVSNARSVSEYVSGVIYVSRHVKNAHESNGIFTGDNVHSRIIHGIYDPPEKAAALRRAPLSERGLRVGFMGRISPEKGLDRLIAQCAALKDKSWSLQIAGSGESDYVAHLRKIADGHPVKFLGVVEPSAYLSQIDTLVVPSLWHDPAPRVAYEAGLNGVIPLVSNRGGLPELVDFGQRGLIFDPDEENGLATAISSMIDNPATVERMRGAWNVVREKFSAVGVAAETVAVYEAAASRAI